MKKSIRLIKLIIASSVLLAASACQQVFGEKYPKVTTVESVPVPVTANLEVQPVATTILEGENAGSNSTTLQTENSASSTTLETQTQPNSTTLETQPQANSTTTTTLETQTQQGSTTTTTEVQPQPVPSPTQTVEPQPVPSPTQTVEPKPVEPSKLETQPVPPTKVTLEQTLTELKAEKTIEGIKVNLPDNILFEFDKYNVRSQAKATLAKVNQLLSHYKEAQVIINGHTDSKGEDAYNLELSQKRSAAVKYYFVNNFKVPAPRIQTKGFGKTKPIAPNENPDGSDNPAGRDKNRRVEFIIKTETRKEVRSPSAEDPYRDAVNKAQSASLLAQTAKTSDEWDKVAQKWQEAIALMQAVPAANSNYKNAQKKAGEYQKNLNYAQQNAE